MADVDNDEVQRLLEDMRRQSRSAVMQAVRALMHRERFSRHPDVEALEAVARDPSLFRAVELRRAELLRQDSNPASGEQQGRSASASPDMRGGSAALSAPAAGEETTPPRTKQEWAEAIYRCHCQLGVGVALPELAIAAHSMSIAEGVLLAAQWIRDGREQDAHDIEVAFGGRAGA